MKQFATIIILLISFQLVGQQESTSFFNEANEFFIANVENGSVNYAKVQKGSSLAKLISQVESQDLERLNPLERQAFLINAYNLLVINSAVSIYPAASVQSIAGFFDKSIHKVGGKTYSLNNLEKKELLEAFQDPRLHFVLVCGAKGCPPIIDEAYMPSKLNDQLERQTKLALNDESFLYEADGKINLSQIFKWYPSDFGGKANIIPFINKYRNTAVGESLPVSYYKYDWSLNDASGIQASNAAGGASSFRYVVSAAIPKGGYEFKLFNNLYTQRTGNGTDLTNRSSFFTTSLSALYGVTSRFNAGLEMRYRRVANSPLPSSATDVFGGGDQTTHRSGITAIGPRIRFAPFKSLENFSIQSTFSLPVGSDLAGDGTRPYIDWNGASFNTQFFNDVALSSNFSLFTEIDVFIEDIGGVSRFSTPVTGILSFFPNKKTTIYALAGYSPYWQSEFDYFVQGGVGTKYQFSPNFEVELLVTKFSNQFLSSNNGDAATFNIGFRYNH